MDGPYLCVKFQAHQIHPNPLIRGRQVLSSRYRKKKKRTVDPTVKSNRIGVKEKKGSVTFRVLCERAIRIGD